MLRGVFLLLMSAGSITSWSAAHHPQDFLSQISGTKTEGAQIVEHYCAMCHAANPLVPLGAPTIGDTAAWEPRVKQGINSLMAHLNEGLNAMPARGGCFECSDEQLLLAVSAMLPPKFRTQLLADKIIKKA